MAQDYNGTLNLPKTDFPMRANLPKREQELFQKHEQEQLYQKLISKNNGKPTYILHDGPPYANGEIHLGTALNKILKDFIVKQKNMSGYCAPYIPGWDTHGLPIELKALKASGVDRSAVLPIDIRKTCKNFALSFVENQKKQFQKLGVIGDYENPYLTLHGDYEANQVLIFGEMAKQGFIYKGLKPVYWCPECNTALAEAEIEYAEDPCYSIYVKFAVSDDHGFFKTNGIDKQNVYFVIWTTTTWTLPGNTAICLGPNYEYTLVHVQNEYYVMAKELVPSAMKAANIEEYETIGSFFGSEFEKMTVQHPFLPRKSLVIVGDHVTLESGTGCVHTAPGHGVDDFEICRKYDGIPILVPVDSNGILTEEAGEFCGLSTNEANRAISRKLRETGHLFAEEKILHQYPHCWRCKHPILFRATEQWFCSISGFREKAIHAIDDVQWIPAWGEERMKGMVHDRSDWCISRQRVWGVPIPIVYCEECGEPIINDETIHAIAELFRQEGSNAWFLKDPSEFLPDSLVCPKCSCKHFKKETDIMDVWFDSGVSHAAVLGRENFPADLCLEGSDQYRGWFQSSLLTSVACRGKAPYKAVCTHGWVVDGEGRKMSKSLANGVAPEKVIQQYGADILRLWVASTDYHADIRISSEILKQLSENYRKIRNTARFILGNLFDFDPNIDLLPIDSLDEIDRLALYRLNRLIKTVQSAYDHFEFHLIFHAVHNFCVIDMSNFYLDIIKDRLYCDEKNSRSRRAAQTTIYQIIHALTRLIAPILAFTSEEIWAYLPHTEQEQGMQSVLFCDMPVGVSLPEDPEFFKKWEQIGLLRELVKKALEEKRAAKIIGSSLEAELFLYYSDEKAAFYQSIQSLLADVFLVSQVTACQNGEGEFKAEDGTISVSVKKSKLGKCERCWSYRQSVGSCAEHPTLCKRCVDVLKAQN